MTGKRKHKSKDLAAKKSPPYVVGPGTTPRCVSGAVCHMLGLKGDTEEQKEMIVKGAKHFKKYTDEKPAGGVAFLCIEVVGKETRGYMPLIDCIKKVVRLMEPLSMDSNQLPSMVWQSFVVPGYCYRIPVISKNEMERNLYPVTPDKLFKYCGGLLKEAEGDKSKTRLVGLDCEMCESTNGKILAHIAAIDEKGTVLINEHVKPTATITNYLTAVSGITEELLSKAQYTREEAVGMFLESCGGSKLLKGESVNPIPILVGHSLENDLAVMGINYPLCVDTALAFMESGRKKKLKVLTKELLHRDIQLPDVSHDPLEDAKASLDLARIVVNKLSNSGVCLINYLKSSLESIYGGTNIMQHALDGGLCRTSLSGCIETVESEPTKMFKFFVLNFEDVSKMGINFIKKFLSACSKTDTYPVISVLSGKPGANSYVFMGKR